jgi:ubiquinone/menaquinone biosynthesis C-methylase UbiE
MANHTKPLQTDEPSLEALVESGMIQVESLHPGGLALTEELAQFCNLAEGDRVLDVACGTGESACHLADRFGSDICGLDHSEELLGRARSKAAEVGSTATFHHGDAHDLPFGEAEFDIAICECTLCLLDKAQVLSEMSRVVRSGGYVAMHDLFWQEDAPDRLKKKLSQLEGEEPETLAGWKRLFSEAGLVDVRIIDRSELKARWMRDTRKQLGLRGQLRLMFHLVRRWGLTGLWTVLRSEQIMASSKLGYAIVIGVKP